VQPLAVGASFADLQRYVAAMEVERGFSDQSVYEQT